MRFLVCVCLLLVPGISLAQSNSGVVVIPIVTGGAIAPSIAKGYDTSLRKAMGTNGKVVSIDATSKAMTDAGAHRECSTDDCGAKVAKASGARFVVFSKVSAADEIYTVTLLLFDAALASRVKKVVKECELCAANEVNGTLGEAVNALRKSMSAPAPAVAKPVPDEPAGGVKVTVETKPAGASVAVGGVAKGKTPLTFSIKPGSYDLAITKEGYAEQTRKLPVLDRPIKLRMTLKSTGKPVAKVLPKPPVVVPPPQTTPDLAKSQPAPVAAASVGTAYNGAALGMIVGGLALSGLGTYLVVLDGEITCPDGTRRDCPTVYNTKGVGLTAFGAGAALIGAGGALIIEDAVRMHREKAKLNVGATPTPDGAYFNISGRF
jgi:hypothetical protein